MDKNAKIYNIVVEYEDETGMMRNSFVEQPAVEYTAYAFMKESTPILFAKDAREQKFMSVSMLANTPIERLSPKGELFYVNFTPETIKKIVNKLVMENKINEVSFQHTNQMIEGVFLVEHFFSEKGRVESPLFKDVPDGSWITTYWVKDAKQYDELLANPEFNGFSIEINAKIEEAFASAFSSVLSEEDLYNEIEVILSDETSTDDVKYEEIKKVLNKK